MAQSTSASLGVASRKVENNGPQSINTAAASSEWDVRNRELEEARARAAQMEKTMKWWSECTNSWREKWSKVRNERNKAREEAKHLRQQLEAAQKETITHKREKLELELQVTQLKREMEKVHHLMIKHAGQFNRNGDEGDGERAICSPDMSSDGLKNVNSEDGLVTKPGVSDGDVELMQEALAKISATTTKEETSISEEKDMVQQLSHDDDDDNFLTQRVTMLQLHLEEAQRTIQVEREEKNALHKNFEKFRHEFHEIREKCEELRAAKQEAVRELLTLQEQHRAEMRITNNTLHEEVAARECLEKRLCDLRTELEKLQSENAAEWGKRERLETEKLTMERENKKLRSELQDLQDRLERKGRPITNDVEVRTMQQELADKTKEIVDLKHSNNKMKKMLAEANTEMGHAIRRADQYEGEVKRLRTRVEELKRELATVEDELDATCNHVRRLQRTNEELIGQNEGFHSQIQQLQARGTNSPKHFKSKLGLPHEYKPNISELKQLFDDSKRFEKRQENKSHQRTYSDAKPTEIGLGSYDLRNGRSHVMAFEKAKQKFDAKNGRSSQGGKSSKPQHFQSNIPKRNNYMMDHSLGSGMGGAESLENSINMDPGVTSPYDDNSSSKGNFSMTSSINLDGLKVSDDE